MFVLSSASHFIASGSECGGTGYHLLWQTVPHRFWGVERYGTYLEDPCGRRKGDYNQPSAQLSSVDLIWTYIALVL